MPVKSPGTFCMCTFPWPPVKALPRGRSLSLLPPAWLSRSQALLPRGPLRVPQRLPLLGPVHIIKLFHFHTPLPGVISVSASDRSSINKNHPEQHFKSHNYSLQHNWRGGWGDRSHGLRVAGEWAAAPGLQHLGGSGSWHSSALPCVAPPSAAKTPHPKGRTLPQAQQNFPGSHFPAVSLAGGVRSSWGCPDTEPLGSLPVTSPAVPELGLTREEPLSVSWLGHRRVAPSAAC